VKVDSSSISASDLSFSINGFSSGFSLETVNQSDDLCGNARTEILVKLKAETPNANLDN